MDQSKAPSKSFLEVDGIISLRDQGSWLPMVGIKTDPQSDDLNVWDVSAKYWGNPDKAQIHDLRYSLEYHGI